MKQHYYCVRGGNPSSLARPARRPDTNAIPLLPLAAGHHCLTCSDEAVAVRVVSTDPAQSIAIVDVGDHIEEVDTTLVEEVLPGTVLLVHAGVAIALLEEGTQ